MNKEIELIRKFKITSKYKGYRLVIEAIQMVEEEQDSGFKITKDIYPVLAMRHHMSIPAAERNMRTVIEKCWENDKELVRRIAGYDIHYCPSNSDFIEFAAYYIRRGQSVEPREKILKEEKLSVL